MTVFVPKSLAARRTLEDEGLMICEGRSPTALRIGLLNLMPDKKTTERQFARVLGQAGCDIELVPLSMRTHVPSHCERTYLNQIYRTVSPAIIDTLDGLVVTGAPVEKLRFDQVDYWREFAGLLDHLDRRPIDTLFVCWSAQAALYHRHGIGKHMLSRKAFGVEPQWVIDTSLPLVEGLGDCFATPVSRHTSVHTLDILIHPDIRLVAGCDATGPALVTDQKARQVYMFNHLEYETQTLHEEFLRDRRACRKAPRPKNFYRNNVPVNEWSTHGQRFFANWLSGLSSAYIGRTDQLGAIEIAA